MLFNSIDFVIFRPVTFALYWLLGKERLSQQNALIVVSSYFFYGWWDWRFLSLMLASTLIDYAASIQISKQENKRNRKILLWISIAANLGMLGFFKYYDFFIESFVTSFSFFGKEINASSIDIVLPVGISFYTFQTLSYTIDVYNKKLSATKDFVAFSAFVSFFPQLVAGPIERATNLLPQFLKKRQFDYPNAVIGLRQILWGFFKKIVIADNCAPYVNMAFDNPMDHTGSTLLVAAILFAFQIYCDFSGYSDIAIGTARLFGISLKTNFSFPYFSRDIAEFWRRWHISLTTWFRDYVYIPIGGNRGGLWMTVRNVLIVFTLSGLWHGANWTFVVWGILHAIFYLPLLLLHKNRNHLETVAPGKLLPSIRDAISILGTFGLTVLAWIFFRSPDIKHAVYYLGEIFSSSFFNTPAPVSVTTIMFILFFLVLEWLGREQPFAIAQCWFYSTKTLRYSFYYLLLAVIFLFAGVSQDFIYFQF